MHSPLRFRCATAGGDGGSSMQPRGMESASPLCTGTPLAFLVLQPWSCSRSREAVSVAANALQPYH